MEIQIVKASEADRDEILYLGEQFPGDYLEYVVDRWINQEEGGLYLARYEGEVAGCCCLSFPTLTEGWLQGMRVHPAFQKRGIAFTLTTYLANLARARGASAVRLLTHPDNAKAKALACKAGFSITGEPLNVFYLEKLREGGDLPPSARAVSWQTCTANDFNDILDYIVNSAAFHSQGKLIFFPGYMYRALTEEYLSRLIESGNVYQARNGNRVLGAMIVTPERDREHILVSYLDAPDEYLSAFISMLPRWRQVGFRFVSMSLLPRQHWILHPLLERFLGPCESDYWQIMELN